MRRQTRLWAEARTCPPKSSQTGGHLDMLECASVMRAVTAPSLPQEIKDESEDHANDYRRHDGKVEDEFAARTLVLHVSRQQG